MTFNSETSVAIASAVVAIFALVVTIWQGRQNYKHNKMSVLPKLSITRPFDGTGKENTVSVDFINSGIGPAIIKDFILTYDGKEVSKNNYKTYKDFLTEKAFNVKILYIYFFSSGATISVNEYCEVFAFQHKRGQDVSFIDKLGLRIHYQSIYEDKIFTSDTGKLSLYSSNEDKK